MNRRRPIVVKQFFAGAFALAFVLAFVAEANDRDLDTAEPATVGMSAAGLGELGAAMRARVDDGELAGIVTLGARQGKVAHFEA